MGALAGVAVLLADDDAESRALLELVLIRAGATVKTAGTGQSALALLSGWTPGAIVLDITLPDRTGFDVLSAIRSEPGLRDVPAVALTGRASAVDRQRSADAGFRAHITKPCDGEALVHLLGTLAANGNGPRSPGSEDFARLLREAGLHQALAHLNARTAYRFSGVYRFDGEAVRGVSLFDRLDPKVMVGGNAQMESTCCGLVRTKRKTLAVADTTTDAKLAGRPPQPGVRAYAGVLLRNADGTPWGTLCHFDPGPVPVTDDLVAFMEQLAPILSVELGRVA